MGTFSGSDDNLVSDIDEEETPTHKTKQKKP